MISLMHPSSINFHYFFSNYTTYEYLHEQEKDFVNERAKLKSGFESSAFQFPLRSQEMPWTKLVLKNLLLIVDHGVYYSKIELYQNNGR